MGENRSGIIITINFNEISQLIKRDNLNAGPALVRRISTLQCLEKQQFSYLILCQSSLLCIIVCCKFSPIHYSAALSLAITSSSNFTMKVVPLCQCADTCNKMSLKNLLVFFLLAKSTLAGKLAPSRTASTIPATNAAQLRLPLSLEKCQHKEL